ncbi:uncharacterized protein LOC133201074 [Saccostrea echinata]|uniref:uncharacterized protein LOC133201074 n=1 Tax=Saccostrea echinata TaxID=191078 RepID=UPI002A820CDC|nr:uncharacterized protein LOC133201074 [Saccostrea echinata]
MKIVTCFTFICACAISFSGEVKGLSDIFCPPNYHHCDGTLYCCPSGYICIGSATCLHLAVIIGPIVGLVVLIACVVVCCICCRRRRSTPGVVYSPTPQGQM